jgi:hypothetical protein
MRYSRQFERGGHANREKDKNQGTRGPENRCKFRSQEDRGERKETNGV